MPSSSPTHFNDHHSFTTPPPFTPVDPELWYLCTQTPLVQTASEITVVANISPARKCLHKDTSIYSKSDESVWEEANAKIITSALEHWSSAAYNHYNI
ncbi:hypothetical protein PAXRUDRAFT_831913 [Paxillus rubicundulus Ve08.2h10]|uniref:Uncharacterized protein n=1 Tax=Paxillus rubicundulus Ve08.2h10 TaxID=930991 RepID=A0A0D0CT86_9AGAM|nr:hypothetical protein PAXRUDRAFT_831913 [Paxillus rubicundulus Ve08.2h10]